MPTVEATIRGPLAGIRVIDLSTVLAGPYATMILADLGADVIKVEPPDGDATRGWGPPWVGEDRGGHAHRGVLPRRQPEQALAAPRPADGRRSGGPAPAPGGGDVLVENFRPGSLDRLGFDDATLGSINPALIHLAISGYGPAGPAADRPGYDFVIQAVGGLMSITGEADEDGGRPTKVGVAISDVVTGLYAAIGVLGGLLARRGDGQRVDVTLLGSTLAVLVNQAQNAFVTGASPVRRGNAHPNIVPYETFATADGELAVAVGSERQWPRFCAALDLPELTDDPRFATNGDRVERRAELRPILARRFAERATAAWGAALDAADVPWGAIADVASALASPEADALEMVVDLDHPVLGPLRQVGIPLRFAATPGSIRTAPPLLGEHTDEVLAQIGYTPAEIGALREDGVV